MPPAKPNRGTRTPGRWPYAAGKQVRRRRVVNAGESAARGVMRLMPSSPRWQLTHRQARIAAAGAALFMLASAGWWAYHSPWLTVSHVKVSGVQSLSAQQVNQAAHLDGDSIFGLDLHGAQARIEALPQVRSATVKKDGIDGVSIAVQERTAWGAWQATTSTVAIDSDGFVLDTPAPAGLPVIVAADATKPVKPGEYVDRDAVQLASKIVAGAQSAFGRDVKALVYRHDTGLTVVFSGADVDAKPVWVTFGDGRDYDYKVAALYALFQRAGQDALTLNVVDLRFGDRLSFR